MPLNRRVIGLLSVGHFTVDIYSGALPLLLYLLRPTMHLSYAMIGVASLLFTLTSSIVQPLFGYLSDRRPTAALLPIGCLLCALGMSAAGLGVSYPLLLVLVVLSGCGSALYHPEAAKTAAYYSGARRGSGMALFSVGGNAGFALGPGLLLLLQAHLHHAAPYALFTVGVLMTVALTLACRPLRHGVAYRRALRAEAHLPIAWGNVAAILSVVMVRSWIHMGLVYFLPYWAAHAGAGMSAGTFVSAFLFAGALGTLTGGPLADRFGRRRVVICSLLPLAPLLLLFLTLQGIAAVVVIALCGALTVSSFSITVVMTQELMTRHVGMASGLSTGFAAGLGGLGVLATGALADRIGLSHALLILALLPLLGLCLTTLLPASSSDAGVFRVSSGSIALRLHRQDPQPQHLD